MDAVCSLLCSWHPGDGMSCEQVNGDYRDLDNLFRTWESLSPTMHHFLVWTSSWVPCFCSFSTEIAYKSTMLAVISQMSPTSLRCSTDFLKDLCLFFCNKVLCNTMGCWQKALSHCESRRLPPAVRHMKARWERGGLTRARRQLRCLFHFRASQSELNVRRPTRADLI